MSPHALPVRLEVPEVTRAEATGRLLAALDRRLEQHGDRAFAGTHEILGTIAEEYHELVEAVRTNDRDSVAGELLDVAVGCLWGVASILAMQHAHEPDTD